MSDVQNPAPPAEPTRRTTRRRRRRKAVSPAAVRKEFKAAAAAVDGAAAPAPPSGVKSEAVAELDRIMAASGLLVDALPEASALAESPEETKAKLTRIERDKLSLAEALAREAELQANDDGSDDTGDAFYFDPKIIPHGWHYEWRRDTVLNQRDPAYAVGLAKRGWRAVPLDQHPEMMPSDWTGGNYIARGGMILMSIPKITHDRLRERDREKARGELENKLAQLSGRKPGDKGGFERRGSTSRDFGAILGANETAFAGGGRTIPR